MVIKLSFAKLFGRSADRLSRMATFNGRAPEAYVTGRRHTKKDRGIQTSQRKEYVRKGKGITALRSFCKRDACYLIGGTMTAQKSYLCIFVFLVIMLSFSFSEAQLSETDLTCLGCHQMDQTMKFANGETISLKVNPSEVEKSVHRIIGCSTCHGFTADSHPKRSYKSRKELSSLSARKCLQCHDTKKNSIHEKLIRESAKNTICTDCHGAHAVKRVRELSKGNQYCLTCHNKELEVHYKDGHKEKTMIDEAALNNSVHKNLSCVDCHVMVSAEEHPVRQFQNKRDFAIVMAENCRRCHFDKYSRTLEGIHFKLLTEGNAKAPICSDCHGTHAIASARKDKLSNARKCEQCHKDIYAIYVKSVHGSALVNENIEDVPICSDCHRAHDNAGPHTANFRISVPQICASCHANKEIMQKYGLSTKVIDTYLQDFHGVTMKFYRQHGQTEKQIAVCIDCHGIHDIARVKNQSAAVVKQHLLKRCQKCHADATANFPDSWVSHYEPNFQKAPLVYLVDLGYKIFIPFMIIGLLLQIVLHLWRYAVNR
jgi:predicted CXXCH cytochrome family protein